MLRQAIFFLLNQTLKKMKKGGTLRKSHPVFAAGSNFTSSITGSRAVLPLSLFLFFSSHPYIHSFVLHPVQLASQLSINLWRTCESLHFSKAQLVVLLFLLSSIRRPLLRFKSRSINKKKGSTMPTSVTGTHRWLHCAQERG